MPLIEKDFQNPHSMHLLALSPELLSTFTVLYCPVASTRGTNATGGKAAHEPGQPDTAFTNLVFHPGLVLPPTDTGFFVQ